MLFNIRWFLGPGIRALRALGRAVFGFHSSLSLQYLNSISSGTEPKILNPLVDALALFEAQKSLPIVQYLNAFDVEDYIISKGAVHINSDIIRLRVSDDDRLMTEWSWNPIDSNRPSHTSLLEEVPDYLSSQTFSSAFEYSSIENFPPGSDLPTVSPSCWGGSLGFDSGSENQHKSVDMSSSDINQTSLPRQNFRTLSVPVLLQNLAKRAQYVPPC